MRDSTINIQKGLLALALWMLAAVAAVGQVSFGRAKLTNDGWRFLRVDTAWNVVETPDMRAAAYDDTGWRRVTLPHDWGVELPMSPDKASCQGFLPGGVGWYRLHFTAPRPTAADSTQQRLYVYFEGVYCHSEVYLNGHLLGRRPNGFASFLYDLTPHLQRDGDNVLAVRVDHSAEADARWYTGSGINRNVWLVSAPPVHLAQWGTAYRLASMTAAKAVIDVDVETTDDRHTDTPAKRPPLRAIVEMATADGRVVARTQTSIGPRQKKTVRLTVRQPRRWTLNTPYLYKLTTRLMDGERETDRSEVKAGLRTLNFSADRGLALNGEWTKVKGVCLHDDAGVLGTAVPKEVWRRRIRELKAIGANAIRMSHNPHAPALYDVCDEEGMLVMDEASDEWELPKRKWLKGWNQGVPGYEGSYTFFDEWIERDVADMVRRDRCHPSVFLWSIGNEVDYPNDPYSHPVLDHGGDDFTQPVYGGYKPDQPDARRIGDIARRLTAVVKAIDTTRPTTGALAGVVMSNETDYPTAVDVVGYNYTESRYDDDHRRYPQRVIYGSENRHDLAAWLAVADRDHIFGQFLWTGADYLGESGPWPARGSTAGLIDLAGERKPLGWYRAALWSTRPTCYIGTYPAAANGRRGGNHVSPYATDTWNYQAGQRVRVVCYTNADSAHLLLNGKPLAATLQRDPTTSILYADVDYQPGTLRCEAANGAAYEVATSGRPYALRLTTDSVAHFFVEVVDEKGVSVKTADVEVTADVGGAQFLGMENGDINHNAAPRRGFDIRPQRRLYTNGGRLVGYFRPEKGQRLSLTVTSPLLLPASLEIVP